MMWKDFLFFLYKKKAQVRGYDSNGSRRGRKVKKKGTENVCHAGFV